MNHLDLFSGIGGFSYAVDQVWPGSTHVFCDNNLFCQKVLAKHWPESTIYGDIRTLTDTSGFRCYGNNDKGERIQRNGTRREIGTSNKPQIDLLTGGFPCQPFSSAGQRRGTADDRYLWPEMLRVIRFAKPSWIIGENVGGFVTWNEGMVLEQVCADLEAEGYEVQPFIIPACAVNAPHRRDRVWIVANHPGGQRFKCLPIRETPTRPSEQNQRNEWKQDWNEVATRLCRVDDGVPRRVDRLKALGNAIVPQVAIEIMRAIRSSYDFR